MIGARDILHGEPEVMDEDEEPPTRNTASTTHIHMHSHTPVHVTPYARGTLLMDVEACT